MLEEEDTFKVLCWGRGDYSNSGNGGNNMTWIDKVIEVATRGSFTHLAILDPKTGFVYEALLSGFTRRKLIKGEEAWVMDTDIPITRKAVADLEKSVGGEYDYLGALLSVFKIDKSSNKDWFCSEHVLNFINTHSDNHLSPKKSTPTDVVMLAMIKCGYPLMHCDIQNKCNVRY